MMGLLLVLSMLAIAIVVDECCCAERCTRCPEGTLYPYLVDVSFPGLGVSVPSLNSEDPIGDGWPDYIYRVEGDYEGTGGVIYTIQGEVGVCYGSFAVSAPGFSCLTSVSVSEANGKIKIVDCDPFAAIYNLPCGEGGTLTVVVG